MTTPSTVPLSDSWRDWLARPVARTARWSVLDLLAPLAARPLRAQDGWRWPEAAMHRSPEERRRRWLSAAASAGTHVALLVLWSWWAVMQVPAPPASSEAPRGDAELQVEYIGIGTPEEAGGGEPDAGSNAPAAPSLPAAASQATTQAATPSSPSATASAESTPASASEQPMPAPQPLTVTQVEQVDTDFVVPPTRTVTLATQPTTVASTQVQVNQREVELEHAPAAPTIITRPLAVPTPIADAAVTPNPTVIRQRDVVLEDVPAPAAVRVPSAPSRPVPAAIASAPAAPVRSRDVPMAATAAASAASAATPVRPSPAPASGAGTAGQPASASGSTASAASPGAGPKPQATAGGWPDPNRGDDWDTAARNRPGGGGIRAQGTGVYGTDGRPNLPPGTAAAGGGMPPGTDDWTRAQIDGNGTWLKRPPLDYRVSPFEQYWRPHETLLEEWVRRGVKQMHIPIPGTSKRITCVVSMLQLGGGCGITDPNVNDQEAIARPPPDIPFKPELQESPDAVTKPPPTP